MSGTEILIFVVDDDPTIIKYLQHALGDAGYAVSSASNGEDAMVFVESKSHDFRGLITDVHRLGATSGWDVAHRARELNPTLPVVYMTGGAAYEPSANEVPDSVLLTKPFAVVQVVAAIAHLMNASSNARPPQNKE